MRTKDWRIARESVNILQAARPTPKISVLIRTMGRPSLQAAVDSVRNQLFKEWELIVVNAGAKALQPLPPESWSAVNTVLDAGQPLDRSSAANALLDAANGQFAIFLDDDDWFLEDHLAKLAQVLDNDATLVAAYSDIDCIDGGDTQKQASVHRFERDFDPAALQLENYLPIHSVLFRIASARTTPACRFEQTLHLFEDWDFWLQLAAKGPFARVPGVSAIYSLSVSAGSGHTDAQSAQRTSMLARLADRQLQRWHAADVVALSLREARRSNQLNQEVQIAAVAREESQKLRHHVEQLAQQAEQLRQQAEGFREVTVNQKAQLAAAHHSLDVLQTQLHLQQLEIDKLGTIRLQHLDQLSALMQSTSWRITRPLRAVRRIPGRIRRTPIVRLGINSARAIQSQLARHGVLGLLRRLPYFVSHYEAYIARMRSAVPAANASVFVRAAPRRRDIRLHPDLSGGGPTIDVKVSVVIPTFNAGPEFVWMLRKLRAQLAVRELEIVVVDSGSSDATVSWAREAGAIVVEILPSEFTHSYSRNLGADHATGDYLLIMVQDAYPIGNYWLYGMLRFLLDHADQGLVAASCAEYSRSDSDMMYDSMINTHYQFLGCLEVDRIGEYKGDDHMALRSQGQLSDVSCLISRTLFQQYRYRGDYAEDLDLGIRLIKGGHRVAMLASIKVIHSHNRPAFYYLKRSFVDVIFLVGLFEDFTYPRCESLAGLLAGIAATARDISNWLAQHKVDGSVTSLGAQIQSWVADARRNFSCAPTDAPIAMDEDRLDAFVSTLATKYLGTANPRLDSAARDEARRFNDSFLARLEHFYGFANEVYGAQDALLRRELAAVVSKTFAAAAGSALAFYCLDQARAEGGGDASAKRIRDELTAGV